MKLDHYCTLYTKINSKPQKKKTPPEESIRSKLLDIGLNRFWV